MLEITRKDANILIITSEGVPTGFCAITSVSLAVVTLVRFDVSFESIALVSILLAIFVALVFSRRQLILFKTPRTLLIRRGFRFFGITCVKVNECAFRNVRIEQTRIPNLTTRTPNSLGWHGGYQVAGSYYMGYRISITEEHGEHGFFIESSKPAAKKIARTISRFLQVDVDARK
jgi:hypothetical protein